MSSHFRNFLNLTCAEKQLFFEALWWQYYTRLLLVFIPFRRIIKLYPSPKLYAPCSMPHALCLDRIKAATAQANLLAFWENRCLVQSLAARRMLSRRGIPSTLHFGMVQNPEGQPTAHAWLTVADFEVVNKGEVQVELHTAR